MIASAGTRSETSFLDTTFVNSRLDVRGVLAFAVIFVPSCLIRSAATPTTIAANVALVARAVNQAGRPNLFPAGDATRCSSSSRSNPTGLAIRT
jgi:hypothetical protein